MNLLESSWFFVSSLIIVIILLVDPKDSQTVTNSNALLGSFSSPGSAQQFIYNFSAILILFFFVLTTILSLGN